MPLRLAPVWPIANATSPPPSPCPLIPLGAPQDDCLVVYNVDPAAGGTEQRRVSLDEINGLSQGVSSNSAAMRSAAHTHPGADTLAIAEAAGAVPLSDDEADSSRTFSVRMSSGTMMLRAESKDDSVSWMFEFQCAIVRLVLKVICSMPDSAAVGSASWQSPWQRQAAEAAGTAGPLPDDAASGTGLASGSDALSATGRAPSDDSFDDTSLSMRRQASDGERSISHGVIAAETARFHGRPTNGRLSSPGSGGISIDFTAPKTIPKAEQGARPVGVRPTPPAAGARLGLRGALDRSSANSGRAALLAASLPTGGSGLSRAFGSPRPQPAAAATGTAGGMEGLFEAEDELFEEEDAPTPSSGLGLGASKHAAAMNGTPSPAAASTGSDGSDCCAAPASPASGLGAALCASQTAPQAAAHQPALSAEDKRFLDLEERFHAKCPIFAGKLAAMQDWQRRTGRPVLGIVAKPTMRRGVSAPEHVPSLTDRLFGPAPVKTEAETHLGSEWQLCADQKQPAMAAATSSRRPATTTHAADKGAFGGNGQGVGSWGVWGCQGLRDGMDDAHLSRPSSHPDSPALAAERRVSLYGVFDGHSGCAAADFVARDIPARLDDLVIPILAALPTGTLPGDVAASVGPAFVETFRASDKAFSSRVDRVKAGEAAAELLPGAGGIESGTTALVAVVDHTARLVVVASVGDCRAIVAGTPSGPSAGEPAGGAAGCTSAPAGAALWLGHTASPGTVVACESGVPTLLPVDWPEKCSRVSAFDVVPPHSPGGALELARITSAGGWVTHDEETLVPKVRGGELMSDTFVIARIRKVASRGESGVQKVPIFRVCGELGVARALGDVNLKEPLLHDFDFSWRTSPDGQRQTFSADLVTATPDVGVFAFDEGTEVMIVACDGLWDVIAPIDAARAACEVLRSGASPKIAARRLAECAIHLGSTDNVTVLVVDLRAP